MAMTRFGAYCDRINVAAHQVTPLPYSFEEGAAFLVTHLTALYALKHQAQVKPGNAVFIHSIAGGVGTAALNICNHLKATAYGSVGTINKKENFLKQFNMPADRIIVRDKHFLSHLESVLHAEKVNGFSAILDSILSTYFDDLLRLLLPQGRHVVFGSSEFMPAHNRSYLRLLLPYIRRPRVDILNLVSQNKSVMCFNLIWLTENLPLFQSMMAELQGYGLNAPLVDSVFDFENLPSALKYFQQGKNTGKVVVKC